MSYEVSAQKITPQQATAWFDNGLKVEEINRKLSPSWVSFLAKQMIGGKFKPTNTIAIAHFGGNSYLVNGQHTLKAIEKSGQSQTLAVARHNLKEHGELVSLYTKYDVGRTRSFTDALRAYDITDVTGLKPFYVNTLAAAVRFTAGGFKTNLPKVDNEEWMKHIIEKAPTMHQYLTSVSGGVSEIVGNTFKQSVLSVALASILEQPTKASEFWHDVAHDKGNRSSPARALVKFLYVYKTSSGKRPDALQSSEYVKVVAYCWNKYYQGKSLTTVKPNVILSKEIKILGTKYANGATKWDVSDKGELIPTP